MRLRHQAAELFFQDLLGGARARRAGALVPRRRGDPAQTFAAEQAPSVTRRLPTLTAAIKANTALFELIPWYAEWLDPTDASKSMWGFFWMFSDALMWEAAKSDKWSAWAGTGVAHPLPRKPFGGVAIADRTRLVRLPCTGMEATAAADLLKFSQADLARSGGLDIGAAPDGNDQKLPSLLPTAELYDRMFLQADVRIGPQHQPKPPTANLDGDSLAYAERVSQAFNKAPSTLGATGSRNSLGTPGKIWAIADRMDTWSCCPQFKQWVIACINHGFHTKVEHVRGKPVARMVQNRGGCHPWTHEDYSQIFTAVAGWCWVKGLTDSSAGWKKTADVYLDRTLCRLVRENSPVPAIRYRGTTTAPKPTTKCGGGQPVVAEHEGEATRNLERRRAPQFGYDFGPASPAERRDAERFLAELLGTRRSRARSEEPPRLPPPPRAPAARRSFEPARVFDTMAEEGSVAGSFPGESVDATWQVIAVPRSATPRKRLCPGDIVVQRALGEGRLAWVRVLGTDVEAPMLYGQDGLIRADTLVIRRQRMSGSSSEDSPVVENVDVITGASPVVWPVELFPPAIADPMSTNDKMGRALSAAIAAVESRKGLSSGTFPVPMTVADISSNAGPFPVAGYREDEEDYIASEAKVAVMYAAYVLRDMMRRFATALNIKTATELFGQISRMNGAIRKIIPPALRGAPRITDRHLFPSYSTTFATKPSGGTLDIQFTSTFDRALEGMIVPSNNARAADCVHGVGYGYLNGSLSAGGFFDPTTQKGIWVAGDFLGGTNWPAASIVNTANDGPSAQASTTRAMARLVSLIATKRALDSGSCDEMLGRLHRASTGPDVPWIVRAGGLRLAVVTHDKIGQGPLKKPGSPLVDSEISVLTNPVADGRKYVVAWQNLLNNSTIQFSDIAKIILETITAYERP